MGTAWQSHPILVNDSEESISVKQKDPFFHEISSERANERANERVQWTSKDGRTNTDGQTDRQTILSRCEDATKCHQTDQPVTINDGVRIELA